MEVWDIGTYVTYTWKQECKSIDGVKIFPIGNTYVETNGNGLIMYPAHLAGQGQGKPLTWEWNNPVTRMQGTIRGIVPGDYSFTIPFLTKGRSPHVEPN